MRITFPSAQAIKTLQLPALHRRHLDRCLVCLHGVEVLIHRPSLVRRGYDSDPADAQLVLRARSLSLNLHLDDLIPGEVEGRRNSRLFVPC